MPAFVPISFASALIIAIGGCATDPEHVLEGTWGGPGFGLTANAALVTLKLPCNSVGVFRGPLEKDEQGRFILAGDVTHFYGAYHVRIVGEEVEPRLLRVSIVVSNGDSRNPEIIVLAVKNADPDFGDYVCG